MRQSKYWADQLAAQVIKEKGKKAQYVVAAGITPSGVVHIGNFREIITVDLVARALKDLGKKVKFIYSWDDYDRFRKVPANVPNKKELEKYLFMPIIDTPDPFSCHENYAQHFERELEQVLPQVGIHPFFIYQHKMYKEGKYADEIKKCLLAKEKIREVLDKYRKELLPLDWWPVRVFCSKCKKEKTKVIEYDGKYSLTYSCECGFKETFDFRKKGIVKLGWRICWPMRWHYWGVDFEPGGKEHSTPGGSATTSPEILSAVYKERAPVYQMYDFIILKEIGGKMSASLGNVIRPADALKVYLPEIVRYFFASTKPKKEFAIPFDEEVLKVYEDFYKCERIFYGREKVSPRDSEHWSRVYEMCCVKSPSNKMPVQLAFKEYVTFINIFQDVTKALARLKMVRKLTKVDAARAKEILKRAKFWVEYYAPPKYKFVLQEKINPKIKKRLLLPQIKSIRVLARKLKEKKYQEKALYNEFYNICEEVGISSKDFFRAVYLVLLAQQSGPRLAPFILAVGQERVAKILRHV